MKTNPTETGIVCSVVPAKSFGGALLRSSKPYLRDFEHKYNDKVFKDRDELKVFWARQGLTYINDEQFYIEHQILVEELEVIQY